MAQEKAQKNESDTVPNIDVSSDNESLPNVLTSSVTTPKATETIVCDYDLIFKALATVENMNKYAENQDELQKSQGMLNQLNKPTSILTRINEANMVDYLDEARASSSRKTTTLIDSNKGLNSQCIKNKLKRLLYKRLEYKLEKQRLESLRIKEQSKSSGMYPIYSESQKKHNLLLSPEGFKTSNRPPELLKTTQTILLQKNASSVCNLKHTTLLSVLACDLKHTNMSSDWGLEQTNISSVCDLEQINLSVPDFEHINQILVPDLKQANLSSDWGLEQTNMSSVCDLEQINPPVSDFEQINHILVCDLKHSNLSSLCDLVQTNLSPESDLKSSDRLEKTAMFPLHLRQDSVSKENLVKTNVFPDSFEQICSFYERTNNVEHSISTISCKMAANRTTGYPGAEQVAGNIKKYNQVLIKPKLDNQDILRNLEKITSSIDLIGNLNEKLSIGINTIFLELQELNRTYRNAYDTFVLLDFNRLSYLKIKDIDIRVVGHGLLNDLNNLRVDTSLLFRDYNIFRLNFLQKSYRFASIPFELLFLDDEKVSFEQVSVQHICDDLRNKEDLEERHRTINTVRQILLMSAEDFKKCVEKLNTLSNEE